MRDKRYNYVEFTLDDVLRKVEPGFDASRRREREYEFSRKVFLRDRDRGGAYAPRPDADILHDESGLILGDTAGNGLTFE